jgi:hypothetical protein
MNDYDRHNWDITVREQRFEGRCNGFGVATGGMECRRRQSGPPWKMNVGSFSHNEYPQLASALKPVSTTRQCPEAN